MNQIDFYASMVIAFSAIIFSISVLLDLGATTDKNAFLNKWTRKTLWLWLPFYALHRLICEVILKK
jgi:hypothetical protein